MSWLDTWQTMQFGLFLWSVCCVLLGIVLAGALYHYHINDLIKRANKLLEQLKKPNPSSPPKD